MHVKSLGCLIALTFASFAAQSAQAGQAADPAASTAAPQVDAKPRAPELKCGIVEYPFEAVRYELQGTTVLEYSLDADGHPVDTAVKQSSGWQTLDRTTVELFEGCKAVKAPEQDATSRYVIQYVWTLDTPDSRRVLVPGSCAPSSRFAGFRALDRNPSGPDGILVRSMVRPDGTPQFTRAERGSAPAHLAAEAVAYLHSCKFALGPGGTTASVDSIFGRVVLKQ